MAGLDLTWGGGAVILHRGFPGGSVVKNPLAMQDPQETYAQSLGQEDPLEEEMATHSSILPWRIPWKEEPGGLQSMGSQSQTQLSKHTHIHTHTHTHALHRQCRIYSLGSGHRMCDWFAFHEIYQYLPSLRRFLTSELRVGKA